MLTMRKRALGFLFPLFLGCVQANTAPVAQEPLDVSLSAAGLCQAAQVRLLALKCQDSQGRLLGGPNKAGQSFSAVCQNALVNHVNVNPVCLAGVKSCQEVDSCPR